MKKFLSLTFKILGSLFLFGIVGLFALGYYFNPDRLKPMVESYVKDNYNRTISIGQVSWKLFPKTGLSIDNISLGNAPGFGEGNFAMLKRASVFVKTAELFSGKVEVESLQLNGPSANLQVNSQGANNWSDLTVKPVSTAAEKSSNESPASESKSGFSNIEFNIENIEIIDGAFTYQDQKSGEKFDVKNFNLSSQNVELGKDFPVDLTMHVVSNAPQLDADFTAKGKLRIPKTGPYDLNAISLDGNVTMSSLAANGLKLSNLKAPVKLEKSIINLSGVSANLYGGSVNGNIVINAQNEPADVQANYDIKGSDITSMLRDLGQKQSFSGKLNMKGNLRFKAHPEKKQLTSSISGAAAINISNGALNGVDLVYWYQTGMNLMKTKNPTQLALGAVGAITGAAGGNSGKTQFLGTYANLKFSNGIMSTNDFNVYNAYVYGLGAGVVNLSNETIDFKFNISGVSNSTGSYKPAGQVIPLTIKGSLDNPKMNVDITPVVGGILQNVIPQKGSKATQGGQGAAGAILQQIFQQ